ncbi:MAG TPA: A24 family peptidase [Kofleriaceae bacterium]|nr:A24 family peptidase [Kofleriaceae bacterium]
MGLDATTIAHGSALLIAAIAAVTDFRRGEIPNWLTLPPLVVAPIAYGILHGPWAALGAVAAMVVCALVPYMLFRRGAAGGGDVKLFAALGAVAGMSIGIEAQLVTFMAAAVITLGRLAWNGRLLRTLSNAVFLGLNPILPGRWRRPVAPELMSVVRLGGFAFVGTTLALFMRQPAPWQ